MGRSILSSSLCPVLSLLLLTGGGVQAQTLSLQPEQPLSWQSLPGKFVDIGISRGGIAYGVSPRGVIWRWGSRLGEEWRRMSGRDFLRVDVDSGNKPWAVTGDGELRYYNGIWWEKRGEGFTEVGAGGQRQVMVVDRQGGLHRWSHKERQLQSVDAPPAHRVDLDEQGVPWMIGRDGKLYQHREGQWLLRGEGFIDLGIGATGKVFALSEEGELQQWLASVSRWENMGSVRGGRSVSAGPNDRPWVVVEKSKLLASDLFQQERLEEESEDQPHLTAQDEGQEADESSVVAVQPYDPLSVIVPLPDRFMALPESASDIAIGSEGSVYVVDKVGTQLRLYSPARNKFIVFPGALKRISVDPQGHLWGVDLEGVVKRHTGSKWESVALDGFAYDIDINRHGAIYATDRALSVHRYEPARKRFKQLAHLRAKRVAVDPQGVLWLINAAGYVQQCADYPCKTYRDRIAEDIAVGPAGSIFITSAEGRVHRFDQQAERFVLIRGIFRAAAIAVGPGDLPWVVKQSGDVLASEKFERDERQDRQLIGRTARTMPKTSIFTFTKRMKFREIALSTQIDRAAGGVGKQLLYRIGTDIYLRKSANKDQFTQYSGSAYAADYDEQGRILLVTTAGELLRQLKVGQNRYEKLAQLSNYATYERCLIGSPVQSATSLEIGAEGSIFYLDNTGDIQRYSESKKKFETFDSGGNYIRMSVDPTGVPWVIDRDQRLKVWNGKRFAYHRSTQRLRDIDFGLNGALYACGQQPDNGLLYYNRTNEDFDPVSNRTCHCITTMPDGKPVYSTFSPDALYEVDE